MDNRDRILVLVTGSTTFCLTSHRISWSREIFVKKTSHSSTDPILLASGHSDTDHEQQKDMWNKRSGDINSILGYTFLGSLTFNYHLHKLPWLWMEITFPFFWEELVCVQNEIVNLKVFPIILHRTAMVKKKKTLFSMVWITLHIFRYFSFTSFTQILYSNLHHSCCSIYNEDFLTTCTSSHQCSLTSFYWILPGASHYIGTNDIMAKLASENTPLRS